MGSRRFAPIGLVRFANSWLVKPAKSIPARHFWQFSRIGTGLELEGISIRNQSADEKGRMKMSGQSKLSQTILAAVAAVLVSSVAVGAAVGPAQAIASPVGTAVHA